MTRKMPAKDQTNKTQEPDAIMLERLLGMFGPDQGYRVKIDRRNELRREWEYLDRFPWSDTLVDDVKTQCGGGSYRGLLFDAGGQYVKGGSLSFSIAGPPKAVVLETPVVPGGENDRLARLEAKMDRTSGDDALARTLGLITGVITALAPLAKPLLERAAQPPSSPATDPLKLLELTHAAEARGEARGKAIGRLEAGGRTDGASIADTYIPPILQLIHENMRTKQLAPNAQPALNQPQGSIVNLMDRDTETPAGERWLLRLRPYYLQLAQQAQINADPNVIADFALTQMDAPTLEHIQRATTVETFKPLMRKELARVADINPAWVEDFLDRIIEDCTADQNAAAPDADERGI